MDNSSEFPLDLYVSSLVRFLDVIEYNDDNFERDERLKYLRYTYSGTEQHFAQLLQQGALKADPKRLEAAMRTSVIVVVCCWVNVPPQVMVDISIFFVYIFLLDDSNNDIYPDMESFYEDLIHGNQQKHPFWRLMNRHLSNFLQHYGRFCGFTIIRSTLDYFQGCWIETHNFQGFPGSDYYPLFLRRLNSLGGMCGGSLFPAENFDEKAVFEEVTTTIAQIEPMVAFVNDLISFYKEFGSSRDQVSLVKNYCQVEGMTLQQAFDRLTNDTIRSVKELRAVFDSGKTPAVAASIHAYIQGYVTWHFCDERYRMREVYEKSTETHHATKFRHYYEAAMKAGGIDVKEWAGPAVTINSLKESPLEESPPEESPLEESPLKESPLEESALKESGLKESALEESALKESVLEESSLEESPLEESPLEESPLEESPLEESPVEESPLEESALKEGGLKESVLEESLPEESPLEESPLEESPVEESPLEESALKEGGLKESVLEESLPEESPLEESPLEESPLGESALKESGLKESGLKESGLKEGVLEESLLEERPLGESPLEESPLEESPLEEGPLEKSPLGESALKESVLEESPLEKSPLEESPLEESPLEESPLGESALKESGLKESVLKESVPKESVLESPLEEGPLGESPLEESPLEESPLEESPLSTEVVS